jgi:6-methylsalicylate decarboxylase
LSTSDAALSALPQFVPTTQIVFGSDFPLAPAPVVKAEIASFDGSPVLDREARAAINRDNALRLFPRFAQTIAPALAR